MLIFRDLEKGALTEEGEAHPFLAHCSGLRATAKTAVAVGKQNIVINPKGVLLFTSISFSMKYINQLFGIYCAVINIGLSFS